tara:strand:- start:45 stop:734 length:690 start_codon:yes stop_codon:yes gene_type:complete
VGEKEREVQVGSKNVVIRWHTGELLHHEYGDRIVEKKEKRTVESQHPDPDTGLKKYEKIYFYSDKKVGFKNKLFVKDDNGKEFVVHVDTKYELNLRPGYHISLYSVGERGGPFINTMVSIHNLDKHIAYNDSETKLNKLVYETKDYVSGWMTVVGFFGLIYPAYIIGDSFNSLFLGIIAFCLMNIPTLTYGFIRGKRIGKLVDAILAAMNNWSHEIDKHYDRNRSAGPY